MSALIRSAEAAAHEKIITDSSAAAQDVSPCLDQSENTDRDAGGTSCAAGRASDNADAKPRRSPSQTAINLFHPIVLCLFRHDERNQGKVRHSGSRGEIA